VAAAAYYDRAMNSSAPAPPGTTLDAATSLAVERTRLAYERTLMAWVRTAAAVITLGFTMYKYFEFERAGLTAPVRDVGLGPRPFALLMIGIGVGTLAFALLQHRRSLGSLRSVYGITMPTSAASVTALLFIVLGLVTMVSVLFRQ
jgi:putative membrane protein